MTELQNKSQPTSKASWLASQSEKTREEFLGSLTPAELAYLEWDWNFWGRPSQQIPDGDWFIWLLLAGRGFGKTRTAVECIAETLRGPSPSIAPPGAPAILSIIADNPFDMRQYSIEGPSGFLNVGPPDYRPLHEPSKRLLTWPNGARAMLFSAEDPETLRGASGSFFWWDELAKSRYAQAGWDNLMFGLREGNPRGIVTTTPRPIPLLKKLLATPSTFVTRGSTWENKENLSEIFYREVIAPKMGTRLGRQEIEAEILDDLPGALWTRDTLEGCRVSQMPELSRIVVAVDPSGTRGESDEGDSIGIIVAGKGHDDLCYILADKTCKESPSVWGRRVVDAYNGTWHFDPRRVKADRVVAERNFGGAMVEHVIRTVDPDVSYKEVNASRGKVARAEPVAALYEQGRVKHVGAFADLEDQLCMIGSEGYVGGGSPDRADAMVWAVTELMLNREAGATAYFGRY